jgi:hypothetical protein
MGHKNINCPKYEKCLALHCLKDSQYWICNNCKYEYKYIKESKILRHYKMFTDYLERINFG